jgi:hypothetical protein
MPPGLSTRYHKPVFILAPTTLLRGQGYITFAVDLLDVKLSSMFILHIKDLKCPTGVIRLLLRMHAGVNGN